MRIRIGVVLLRRHRRATPAPLGSEQSQDRPGRGCRPTHHQAGVIARPTPRPGGTHRRRRRSTGSACPRRRRASGRRWSRVPVEYAFAPGRVASRVGVRFIAPRPRIRIRTRSATRASLASQYASGCEPADTCVTGWLRPAAPRFDGPLQCAGCWLSPNNDAIRPRSHCRLARRNPGTRRS